MHRRGYYQNERHGGRFGGGGRTAPRNLCENRLNRGRSAIL